MKKFLPLLVFWIFAIQSTVLSQSPIVQSIIDDTSIDSLVHFVEELSGEVSTIIGGVPYTIVSRHKYQPSNDKAADYIEQKLQSYGLIVYNQSFSSTGRNVYAIQTGTEYPNQSYMICAHYDDMPSGSVAPGADDNASGTAAVLEAARIFSTRTFPFTIIYALWDEEEQGLVGSEYYATQAANAGDSLLGVINLDMIAYDSNNDGNADLETKSVANSYDLKDKMLENNSVYGINLDLDVIDPGSPYSDHSSFWDHGFSALLLIEDDDNFNAYYHTVNDLITHFNFPYYEKMTKLAFSTLATFAYNLDMRIAHTPLASIENTDDILCTAQIVTGLEIGTGSRAPRLYYKTYQGAQWSDFYEVVGTETGNNTFNFTIPGQSLGTIIKYYLAAQDEQGTIVATLPVGGGGFDPPGSIPPDDLYQFFVATTTVAFSDNAMNTDNWTATGNWDITTQKYVSAPNSFTDSPGGQYPINYNATFTYNGEIDLSNILGATIGFQTQWDIEDNWDYGQIQLPTNSGNDWIPMPGSYTNPGSGSFQPTGEPLYDGTQLSWVEESIDISDYIGEQITFRFLLKSDSYINEDGWYIDDINVVLYEASVVPVELVSFTGEIKGNQVNLEWSTASETNNYGFEVQKSVYNGSFQKIAFIEGIGTSTEINQYKYYDNVSDNNIDIRYRLKQIDFDGTYSYSKIINIGSQTPIKFALDQNYPNPFNPSTKIKYQIPENGFVSLIVYDVLGNELITLVNEEKKSGKYEVEFIATEFSSGIYFYTLRTNEYISTKKMILVK